MLEFVLEWLSRPYLCGPALATGVLTGRVGPHLVIFTSPLTLQEHTEVLYIVNIYSPPPPPHPPRWLWYECTNKHCNCTCIKLYQFFLLFAPMVIQFCYIFFLSILRHFLKSYTSHPFSTHEIGQKDFEKL